MISKIIGKQLARIKFAKDYVLIIFWILTGLSTFSTYIALKFSHFILLLIFSFFSLFLIGYIIDKTKIKEFDQQQTIIQNYKGTNLLWKKAIFPNLKIIIKEAIIESQKEEKWIKMKSKENFSLIFQFLLLGLMIAIIMIFCVSFINDIGLEVTKLEKGI